MSSPQAYAEAVVLTLSSDFGELATHPHTANSVEEAIARHVRQPDRSFSVVVDNPSIANWVLSPDLEDIRRLVLVCRRFNLTDMDNARQDRINARLQVLPL